MDIIPVLGSYVNYKNVTHLAVAFLTFPQELITIINPLKGQGKLSVSPKNLTLLVNLKPAKLVIFENTSYLVTIKGLVVSCKSRRILKPSWHKHADIVALAA